MLEKLKRYRAIARGTKSETDRNRAKERRKRREIDAKIDKER